MHKKIKKPGKRIYPGRLTNHGATRFQILKISHANEAFAARITVRRRQSLLAFFRFALESPFPRLFPTAIAPPAALCKVQRRGTPLSLRFNAPILSYFFMLVNPFFNFNSAASRLRPQRRSFWLKKTESVSRSATKDTTQL